MFYIRADANSEIGSGHIMRCLAIAKALKEQGHESTFITANRDSEKLIIDSGFTLICMNTLWNQLEDETDTLIQLIQTRNISKLLLDSYFVTEKYMERIKKYTRLIYIDDLDQFIYPADLLINYNIYAKQLEYPERYKPMGTRLLLGCDYAPLRREFRKRSANRKETVSNVFVTTGGSDSFNIAGNLITHIFKKDQYKNINFHVVVGSLNPHKNELYKTVEQTGNIILHSNVTEMANLMSECDLAISAGGSTLYELCACGVPAISFSVADNQLYCVNEFYRQGIIYYSGDARENLKECLDNTEQRMKQLIQDWDLRKTLSGQMQKLIDGMGTDRIIEHINTL